MYYHWHFHPYCLLSYCSPLTLTTHKITFSGEENDPTSKRQLQRGSVQSGEELHNCNNTCLKNELMQLMGYFLKWNILSWFLTPLGIYGCQPTCSPQIVEFGTIIYATSTFSMWHVAPSLKEINILCQTDKVLQNEGLAIHLYYNIFWRMKTLSLDKFSR